MPDQQTTEFTRPKDTLPRRMSSVFKVRRWFPVFIAFFLGALGLSLLCIGRTSILTVPGAALLALCIVVMLGDGSGRSVLTRRSGRATEKTTPDAILWLWCFAGLMAALISWEAMAMANSWIEAEAGRHTSVVITASSPGTQIAADSQPAR
ncbi:MULTISPECIES: hypothetical protein [unclassified Caulobacter]|uniref:hypothetical protein n=1 Tax=unclassified Caulobacter TaxID=2648921 RepID=UPI0006F564AD|nr:MULTISPECIES: hypothetical protein [unclassified Caulobacter]KQV57383.1 hypothetical protein ASC62_14095 [Caulobacter sp. Root342]KQV66955.1 hypothetical protein ASC70_14195 [Caulobacter sp. Root343]